MALHLGLDSSTQSLTAIVIAIDSAQRHVVFESSLSFDEAAALPLAGLTAYQVLTRLGTGAGDTVLVHGASGGVGSIGVQVARALAPSA